MSSKPRLDRVRALAEANLQLQQFGQGNDDEVHLGATACTHTVCQFLSLVWNGTIPTLNRVNRLAGMKPNATNEHGKPRGMFQSEFKQFLKNADIPMELRFGLQFSALLKAADDGPVFYAMRYGSAPKKTMAHPNGTTQTGPKVPDTRHAVLMLGHLKVAGPNGGPSVVEVYRKDPNHGSKNRKERPPYDTLSDRQARIEYEDYKGKLNQTLYAALPTRPLPVIGQFGAPPTAPAPPLVVTNLIAFNGEATIRGDNHFAVQIADREFIALADGTKKRVVALGKLKPRLPGPSGDRTNVAIVGDEAAVLLRADIMLVTDGGIEVPPPPTEADEIVPIGEPIVLPDGDAPDGADESLTNDTFPLD
jgi:hypothetical protein